MQQETIYIEENHESPTVTQNSNQANVQENQSQEKPQESNSDSSELDESSLSQKLPQSGFLFTNQNSDQIGKMFNVSENPYSNFDTITRFPIKKD